MKPALHWISALAICAGICSLVSAIARHEPVVEQKDPVEILGVLGNREIGRVRCHGGWVYFQTEGGACFVREDE